MRALDNAYFNKKKSKNGVKEPFGCAIAVDTTVPEESLANCAFSTSTGITETVQKTCDDLTGMILNKKTYLIHFSNFFNLTPTLSRFEIGKI